MIHKNESLVSNMLSIANLSKSFDQKRVVDNISFNAVRGQILGFLGPNGAGKSTTMRMITGALKPDAGQIFLCDTNVVDNPVLAKHYFGYLPEGAPLYGDMTPLEYLNFIADVRGIKSNKLKDALDRSIYDSMISEILNSPINYLSKGYKRRVGLAGALLADPEILILDEPTDGLDPNQKRHIRKLMKRLAKNKTIIISTHILEEVDAVCTDTIIINNGRIVASATPSELLAMSPTFNAIIMVIQTKVVDECAMRLEQLKNVSRVVQTKRMAHWTKMIVYPQKGKYILGEVADIVHKAEYLVAEMKCDAGRLDDVFRELTQSE